jgi:hypothetical protein
VIVDPMIIAAAGFSEDNAVVFEATFFQPSFCHFTMRFSARSEEIDDMSFVEPLIAFLKYAFIFSSSALQKQKT